MRIYDLIHKKREGEALTEEEIDFFVNGYVKEEIPDYQISALLMAIYFKGMNDEELFFLTKAMAFSGDQLDLSQFSNQSVDKHSTGGVGDKTSLIVGPIVASVGAKLAKMSGRGLGHTGGTIDKLESIPGYRSMLSKEDFLKQVEQVGIAIVGQSGNLTPADKKIYALRDVTDTVDSIPLIASSIMSKKIAAGAHSIVLDIKVGSGAFMKSVKNAEILASKMLNIGHRYGRKMAAILTNMDVPLGHAVGNSLEVMEAVRVLQGKSSGDLRDVCVEIAAQMISTSLNYSEAEAKVRALDALNSGRAFEKFKEWIAAQGGNVQSLLDFSLLPQAIYCMDVKSTSDGYIHCMNTEQIGIAAMILGAGRTSKVDPIDYGAGIEIYKKTGDYVHAGDTLCTVFSNRNNRLPEAAEIYQKALRIETGIPPKEALIFSVIR